MRRSRLFGIAVVLASTLLAGFFAGKPCHSVDCYIMVEMSGPGLYVKVSEAVCLKQYPRHLRQYLESVV